MLHEDLAEHLIERREIEVAVGPQARARAEVAPLRLNNWGAQ